ncbi:MAG: YciI family protein [Neisseria sp.]|uniref:YciI family protein n=1 Tax=Neisseria sp. TaxID=192066 RepID=UPI0026DDB7C6|nr:YciI family protein [Neisseria sp.]MDO4249846.1 YciI family protein [Neisseria sp.]
MYLIDITIKTDAIPAGQSDTLLAGHRAWFTRYFEQGKFLMLGPYRDQAGAGVIIAQTGSREELDAMLAEDVYWANKLADYRVREFQASLIAENLNRFTGK